MVTTLPASISATMSATGSTIWTPDTALYSTEPSTSWPTGPANPATTSKTSPTRRSLDDIDPTLVEIGAGISVGSILAIAGISSFVICRRRRQSKRKPNPRKRAQDLERPMGVSELEGNGRVELWAPPTVAEVGTSANVSELPGDIIFIRVSSEPDVSASTMLGLEGGHSNV